MMRLKKLFLTVLVSALLLVCGISAGAAEVYSSGHCGPDIAWTLYDDGFLEIIGKGQMPNYNSWEASPWHESQEVKMVTISEGVTSIGDRNFMYCGLTSITVPESVTSIGEDAFTGCSKLENIILPKSVISIGNRAFFGCSSLADITIPGSVKEIGDETFCECTGIESVTICDGVTTIGVTAFQECNALTTVTIPKSVTTIETAAFWVFGDITDVHYSGTKENWKSISIEDGNPELVYSKIHCTDGIWEKPAEVVKSGNCGADGDNVKWTLYDNRLMEITGNGKMMDFEGFDISPWCDKNRYGIDSPFFYVNSIIISDGVTSIGDYEFAGCYNLVDITIPESVTSIANNAFYGCGALKNITIPESVTSIGKDAFYDCSSLQSITVPKGVKSFGNNAFKGCVGLESVVISEGVENIGDGAFSGCKALKSITIPGSVQSTGKDAFRNCDSLESVTISEGVKSIGDWCFYYSDGIKSVIIPESVTSIGEYAFAGCSGLTSISIPKSVTFIGGNAFAGNILSGFKITDVYYSGTKDDWANVRIESGNETLKNATMHYEGESEKKEPQTSISLTIGKKDAVVDGETVTNDVAPKIVNSRTMLPIRVIAEALGAKVEWLGDIRTVKITADNIEISLVIGDSFAMVNGEKTNLDSPSFIENGRTYLPLRFVAEKLGADVEWDGNSQTVYITK